MAMTSQRRFAGAVLVGLLPAFLTQADLPAEVVNFDTYPGGAPVLSGDLYTTQYSSLGVEFHDGSGGGVGASGNACSYSPPFHAYALQIVAVFVDPCTGVPSVTTFAGTRQDNCWVPGEGIGMVALNAAGDEIGSLFNSGAGNFESFTFPQPIIARLVMSPVLQGIDDFTFNPPVPVLQGDLNCDQLVTLDDIGPFITALLAPGALQSCDDRRADMNCDRKIDGRDVPGFVNALTL